MEFRHCPSFVGYSATQCGVIRRDDRAGGKPLAQQAHARKPCVMIGSPRRRIRVSVMVADAWPTPTYFTGWTLAEEYRVVPSAPKYEVSLAGRIRNIDTMRETTIYGDDGRDRVWVAGSHVLLQTLINEAWPECVCDTVRLRRKRLGNGDYMPLPTYSDGKIISLIEYRLSIEKYRF